jgi:nitrate reductase NapAB chaperone NapD
MPVLGLVLVLDGTDPALPPRVAGTLAQAPGLELGELAAHRWPAVLESKTESEAEARIDALRSVPGILGVDVVYADFEDLLTGTAPPFAREEV